MTRNGPPTFAKTKDLTAQRRAANGPALHSEAWLRDIRNADDSIDDDPLNSRT